MAVFEYLSSGAIKALPTAFIFLSAASLTIVSCAAPASSSHLTLAQVISEVGHPPVSSKNVVMPTGSEVEYHFQQDHGSTFDIDFDALGRCIKMQQSTTQYPTGDEIIKANPGSSRTADGLIIFKPDSVISGPAAYTNPDDAAQFSKISNKCFNL